jgi:hypothetical protein
LSRHTTTSLTEENAMTYTILIYETPHEIGARTDAKRKDAYWGAYRAYTVALREAGVMVGGHGLQPAAVATTVRQRDGKRQVQDGPYAEAKEQLGGYYVIDVPDLDKALEWAARCPAASSGAVEVRPNLAM